MSIDLPVEVRRVQDRNGSHIEPEFDPNWSELRKLRWKAAVASCDGGVPIRVEPGELSVDGVEVPDVYSVSCGRHTFSPTHFSTRLALDVGTLCGSAGREC